jgi:predicted secreted protein
MGIMSGIVLYAVIWFMVLFITLPIRLETQGDVGEIVPGTHAGSPTNPQLKKRFGIVTLVSAALWLVIGGTIISGAITVCDFDWAGTMTEICAARETDG